jgi:hypothetical protein
MGGFLTKPVDQLSPAIVKQSRSIFTPHLTENDADTSFRSQTEAENDLCVRFICLAEKSVTIKIHHLAPYHRITKTMTL